MENNIFLDSRSKLKIGHVTTAPRDPEGQKRLFRQNATLPFMVVELKFWYRWNRRDELNTLQKEKNPLFQKLRVQN